MWNPIETKYLETKDSLRGFDDGQKKNFDPTTGRMDDCNRFGCFDAESLALITRCDSNAASGTNDEILATRHVLSQKTNVRRATNIDARVVRSHRSHCKGSVTAIFSGCVRAR